MYLKIHVRWYIIHFWNVLDVVTSMVDKLFKKSLLLQIKFFCRQNFNWLFQMIRLRGYSFKITKYPLPKPEQQPVTLLSPHHSFKNSFSHNVVRMPIYLFFSYSYVIFPISCQEDKFFISSKASKIPCSKSALKYLC